MAYRSTTTRAFPATRKASYTWRLLLLCFLALLRSPAAHAVDPNRKISQYGHAAWLIQDGTIPPGTTIAQTTDGYLWLGTADGLLRFDGETFVHWQPPKGQALPGTHFSALLGAQDGSLWIGTTKGISRWQNGHIRTYSDPAKPFGVAAIIEDRSGTIWFTRYGASARAGPLCSIGRDTLRCFGKADGIPVGYGLGLTQDRTGEFWFGSSVLCRWRPGAAAATFFADIWSKLSPRGTGVVDVAAAPDGTMWAALDGTGPKLGIRHLVEDKWMNYVVPGFEGEKVWSHALLMDREGSLWVGTEDDGIYRLHHGVADHYTTSDGLSGNAIALFYEDQEGNIWVRTDGGLDMFRNTPIITYTTRQGLSTADLRSIIALRNGSIWVGSTDGIDILQEQNGMTAISGRQLPGHSIGPMLQDRSGKLWISEDNKLLLFHDGHFREIRTEDGQPLPAMDSVRGIAEDANHAIWVLTWRGRLFRVAGDKLHKYVLPKEENGPPAFLAGDRSGGLWFGALRTTTITYYRDGQLQRISLSDPRRPIDITGLRPDDDALLVFTLHGLLRWKHGQLSTLTTDNGLPCDEIHSAIRDSHDALWLYTQCGLVRIDAAEYAHWAGRPHTRVRLTLFDARDGARMGTGSPSQPRAFQAEDGRLWSITGQAAQVIDPAHLYGNTVVPPVWIEGLVADHKALAPQSDTRVPALTRDLRIDYTALSFSVPQKVRFRYILDGHDREWHEAGNRRQAFYNDLAPGKYRFRVVACNNDGLWNEAGAALELSVLPAYYQTTWFRALCAAAFLALLWAAHRFRVRQLRRQEKKLRDVIETMPTFAWTALPDGSRDFVNQRWSEYTGLSPEQTLGAGWETAVHPEDVKRYAEKWSAAVTSGTFFESEVRFKRSADGQYRWFMTRAVPLRNNGEILKWYGTSVDIEDRKRAEQLQAELAHVNRITTMGELAASLSHELKQPIAAAILNARVCVRWLGRDPPDIDEAREAAIRMANDGMRASELIGRVRELYKKSPPHRERVDLNEIIREMAVLLRAESMQHAVSIRTELATDVPHFFADRVQLQQVLMNLMLNGIEAMQHTGGVLLVKSQLGPEDQLLVSVSDTGVGLPSKEADRIFDPFVTTKPQGSGMGLAISRSIIESHRGHIWATANRGRGATFHFSLPCVSREQAITSD